MTKCHAVLTDTVSIQGFIFGSKRLKENIGASFLIENKIYGDFLGQTVRAVFGADYDLNAWKHSPDSIAIDTRPFEVGYIGGGNGLFLFREKADADRFIREYSKRLIIQAPQVALAFSDGRMDLDRFQTDRRALFKRLNENKWQHVPQTVIPSHGITAECTRTGLSLDLRHPVAGDYVSASASAKLDAAAEANQAIRQRYSDLLKDGYQFTDDLGQLGQREGEDSHIAVVHVDGNDISDLFDGDAGDTLPKLRRLSMDMSGNMHASFRSLLALVAAEYPRLMESLGHKNGDRRKPKTLPLRPLIIGGDDITFVAEGRLGIYFAEQLISAFERHAGETYPDLSLCAGVAVIKTKYPFYRGYKLAEELCRNAKEVRRERGYKGKGCSYIDFHISLGAFTGELNRIRQKHFRTQQGSLVFRPLRCVPAGERDEKSFAFCVRQAKRLSDTFPKNKIHEIRQALYLSKEAAEQFRASLEARKLALPEFPGRGYETSLYEHDATPYYDLLELIRYYPLNLLKGS